MHYRRCRGTRAVLLSLLGIALAGPAAAVQTLGLSANLQDLIDGNLGFQVGDTGFLDFSYQRTGDMPDASLVNVVGIQDDAGYFGIRIQGGFIDLVSSPGASDALISFSVARGFDNLLTSVTLAGNPALIGDHGHISVVETFDFDVAAEHVLAIFADGDQGLKHLDTTQFDPRQSLRVTKDILALALGGESGGTPILSFIDQTFGTPVPVPEPASALLVGLGLVALAARRGRRH